MSSFHYIGFEQFQQNIKKKWKKIKEGFKQKEFLSSGKWADNKLEKEKDNSLRFSVIYKPESSQKSYSLQLRFPFPDEDGNFIFHSENGKKIRMIASNFLEPDDKTFERQKNPDVLDIKNYRIMPAWEIILNEFASFLEKARITSINYKKEDETCEDFFLKTYCSARRYKSSLVKNKDHYHYFFGKIREIASIEDETNPLARLTQCNSIVRKRVLANPEKDRSKETEKKVWYKRINEMSLLPELRDIHPSYKGRICPVESPESKKVGLSLQLATCADVDEQGVIHEKENIEPALNYSIGVLQIPYLSHNDAPRLMMGGKNLKQALVPVDNELPLIKTGMEFKAVEMLQEKGFPVFRKAPFNCEVLHNSDFRLVLKALEKSQADENLSLYDIPIGGKPVPNYFELLEKFKGQQKSQRSAGKNNIVTKKGKLAVRKGILADENGNYGLALGCNLKVVYMPWYGYNFEDAVVISENAAAKLKCKVVYRLHFPDLSSDPLPRSGNIFEPGQFFLANNEESAVPEWAKQARVIESGQEIIRGEAFIFVDFFATMEVIPGDKLMGRYGNKGVVSRIVKNSELPDLHLPDGRTIKPDLILNPHGILSRKNLGQLFETQTGLLHLVDSPDFDRVSKFAEPFACCRKSNLAEDIIQSLEKAGCGDGQIEASIPGIEKKFRVTAGIQYFCRLNHHPWSKLTLRGRLDSGKGLTGQPVAGIKKYGIKNGKDGGQRLGEMEMWALFAHGALENLKEITQFKSTRIMPEGMNRSFVLFLRYLFCLGIGVNLKDGTLKILKDFQQAVDYAENLGWQYSTGMKDESGDRIHIHDLNSFKPGSKGEPVKVEKHFRPVNYLSGLRCDFFVELPDNDFPPPATMLTKSKVAGKLKNSKGYFERPYLNKIFFCLATQAEKNDNELQKLYDRYTGLICISTGEKPEKARLKIFKPDNPEKYNLFTLLTGKKGLMRHSLLGRRVDCSGRAVIIPAPELKPDEVSLPFNAHRCMERDFEASYCLLNRNPSLHKYSLNACRIKEISDLPVIGLSPLLCGPFGADFDGDSMAFHLPLQSRSENEMAEKMTFKDNCFSVATGENLGHFSLDIKLGIYCLIHYAEGRVTLKKMLEKYLADEIEIEAFPDLLENVTALQKFKVPARENYVNFMHELSLAAFQLVTVKGYSMGLGDLLELQKTYISGCSDKVVEKEQVEEELQKLVRKINHKRTFFDILVSGAKDADCSNLRQMVVAAGKINSLFQNDCNQESFAEKTRNAMKNPPDLKGCFLAGFKPDEYWSLCRSGRAGMVKKKLSTAKAGHFTRLLVESAFPFRVSSINDCGSQEGIPLPESKQKSRVPVNSKPDLFRTPLCCRLPQESGKQEFCQKCLGKDPSTGKFFEPGEFVGIVASESVGERGTQESMKAFHKGAGGEKKSDEDNEEKDHKSVMALFKSELSFSRDFNKEKSRENKAFSERFAESEHYCKILPVHFEILAACRKRDDKILSIRKGIKMNALKHGIYGILGSEGFLELMKNLLTLKKDSAESFDLGAHPKKILLLSDKFSREDTE